MELWRMWSGRALGGTSAGRCQVLVTAQCVLCHLEKGRENSELQSLKGLQRSWRGAGEQGMEGKQHAWFSHPSVCSSQGV